MAYTGVTMDVDGIAEVMRKFNDLEKIVRREANREMRQGSKNIAWGLVNRRHQYFGRGAMVQVDSRIVDAVGVKYDRYVAVQLPQSKPRMSGLKKIPAGKARSLAIAVEWGSDYPPLHGPPRGALVGRNIRRIELDVRDDWLELFNYVLRKYGLI